MISQPFSVLKGSSRTLGASTANIFPYASLDGILEKKLQ
jgi:hypothetical protein